MKGTQKVIRDIWTVTVLVKQKRVNVQDGAIWQLIKSHQGKEQEQGRRGRELSEVNIGAKSGE